MQTREQEYATIVHRQISTFKSAQTDANRHDDTDRALLKQYGAMAHQLPVLVRTAGLAQALTFLETRDGKAQKQLLEHLAEVTNSGTAAALLARARTADLPAYMRLTQQVLAALVWYKRFAQSVLEVAHGE